MRTLVLGTIIFALNVAVANAAAIEYTVGASPDEDGVVFVSKAPLEDFEGRTNSIGGTLRCDPADLSAGLSLRVQVELADLDTGIGLRNRHMRENHLHTEKHPHAVFTAERLTPASVASLERGKTVRLEVAGRFDLHGVSQERNFEIDVHWREDGSLDVSSDFVVSLSAHEIPRPKFLVMKVADEQLLRVRLRAIPTSEGSR